MAYERSESAQDNFGKFINQFQRETKTLVGKLKSILIKLYRQNVLLLFNQTCLNERLLPNHTHTHTHIYIYIYIYCYSLLFYLIFLMSLFSFSFIRLIFFLPFLCSCLYLLNFVYSKSQHAVFFKSFIKEKTDFRRRWNIHQLSLR